VSADLVTVAPMTPDDLDEIMPLERQCFADPWTRRMYLSDLTTNEAATYLVVRHGDAGTRGRGDTGTISVLSASPWFLQQQPAGQEERNEKTRGDSGE
jgi:hypothetical protein